MLRRTFLHAPGVGRLTERSLWKQGCLDWDCFLQGNGRYSAGSADRGLLRDFIAESKSRLEGQEHQFFARTLGLKEAWRAYSEFAHSCAYLDIETDGRSITMIGLYDGASFTCLVRDENLENFRDAISRYSMIVSFCGGTFDLPAIQRQFSGLHMDQIHVDLCPLLRKLGYRGGLKKIEKDCGIERPPDVDGLTGFDAVVLWRRYRGLGDALALDRLIAYNREDCVNLRALAIIAVEKMQAATLA